MSFVVELSPTAEADLERLFDFLLDRAETSEGLDRAQAAIDAIRAAARHRRNRVRRAVGGRHHIDSRGTGGTPSA